MTPEEIQKVIEKEINEYMRNVDNLHIIENHLVNQNSFHDQIAASLIRKGKFTEELSQSLAANLTPVINELIEVHEKNCDIREDTLRVEKSLGDHIKETNQDKRDVTKTISAWAWKIFEHLIQIIVILVGLLLATDGFKK